MRYVYGLQGTPYCALCQHCAVDNVASDVIHILGGCLRDEKLRKVHCLRHDQTVENCFESVTVTRGNKGAAKVLHDIGKYQDMDDNRKHTLPQYEYLHSERIADRRAVRRPVLIVIIYRLRGDRELYRAGVCPIGQGG
eukprot:2069451-Pyramimonas_sp.AAC.3